MAGLRPRAHACAGEGDRPTTVSRASGCAPGHGRIRLSRTSECRRRWASSPSSRRRPARGVLRPRPRGGEVLEIDAGRNVVPPKLRRTRAGCIAASLAETAITCAKRRHSRASNRACGATEAHIGATHGMLGHRDMSLPDHGFDIVLKEHLRGRQALRHILRGNQEVTHDQIRCAGPSCAPVRAASANR